MNDVLAHVELRMEIIKNELLAVKAQYGDDRRTDIVYASEEFNPEDFYADEEMVITISHMGYIKRCPNIKCRTGEESDRKVRLHGMKTSWNI